MNWNNIFEPDELVKRNREARQFYKENMEVEFIDSDFVIVSKRQETELEKFKGGEETWKK